MDFFQVGLQISVTEGMCSSDDNNIKIYKAPFLVFRNSYISVVCLKF